MGVSLSPPSRFTQYHMRRDATRDPGGAVARVWWEVMQHE